MKRRDIIKQKRAKKAISPKVLGSLTPYQIIWAPLMTEKVYKLANDHNKYTFRVHKDANKNDVKLSLKTLYDVTPKSVNIMNVPYKGRTQRKLVRRAFKKAIVTLNEWDSIELAA